MKPEMMISTQLEYTLSDAFNLTYEFRSPYIVRKLHHEMYQLKECNLRYCQYSLGQPNSDKTELSALQTSSEECYACSRTRYSSTHDARNLSASSDNNKALIVHTFLTVTQVKPFGHLSKFGPNHTFYKKHC